LSPRGTRWYGETINRILIDETHLGKIISNKHKGEGHVKKKPNATKAINIPKEQWIVIENCHEAVKTQEEHEKILLFLHRVTNVPKRKPKQILPLTGLIKCGMCGHTMSLYIRKDRNETEYLKPCWYKDAVGNKCPNHGMTTKIIYPYLRNQILQYKQQLADEINNTDINNYQQQVYDKIDKQKQLYNQKEKSLSRIQDAFENGVYSLIQFKERKEKSEKTLEEIDNEIQILTIQLKQFDSNTFQDRIDKLNNFLNEIEHPNLSYEQQNLLYKSIIKSIIWTKKDNVIDIQTNFI